MIIIIILIFLLVLFNRNVEPYKNDTHHINVKVVSTTPKRNRGLMFRRKRLKEDEGMLFVYPKEGIYSIWMKNTYIPLDVIHLDNNNRVVGLIENAIPHSLESRSINKKSMKFIEMNSGYIKNNNIKVMDTFMLTHINELS